MTGQLNSIATTEALEAVDELIRQDRCIITNELVKLLHLSIEQVDVTYDRGCTMQKCGQNGFLGA